MRWLCLLFVLFLPSEGLLNLDFQLCEMERVPLFYSERIKDTSVVTFYTIYDCKQFGSGQDIKPVSCTNHSVLELDVEKVLPHDAVLRVDLNTRRIGYCGIDTFRASSPESIVKLQRDPKCSHYEPKSKDAVRFYLVCDPRLPHGSGPTLLAISAKYRRRLNGHRLRWAVYGWCFSIIASCTVLLILLFVKREIPDNKRPKRSKKKGKMQAASQTMPLASSATTLAPQPSSQMSVTKTQSSASCAPLPAVHVVPKSAPAPKPAPAPAPAPASSTTPEAAKTPNVPAISRSSAVLDPTQPPNTDIKENTGK